MSGRYLLDTNLVIAVLANERSVLERVATADTVLVPVIALGELYYGAQKSSRLQETLTRIDALAAGAALLKCDQDTARWYGHVKNGLRGKGRPIPENDIWIAAVAMQHNLVVVTRDSHFAEVTDLSVEVW